MLNWHETCSDWVGATKRKEPTMRIESGMNALFTQATTSANPLERTEQVTESNATRKSQDVSNLATTSGIKTSDFTSMTEKQMHDWMNNKIRAGQMSLDESTPLMMLHGEMPINGYHGSAIADDQKKINFFDQAQIGIQGALSRGDQNEARYYQAALDTMLKYQGQTIGIDTTA